MENFLINRIEELHKRNIKLKKYPFWRLDTLFSDNKYIDLNVINDGGWHFTNLKTPEEMYEKFMNFGHHDEFRLSGITVEKIREKIANKEMFYDHFADKSSTNKWESNYKLKLLNEKVLPRFLIENKNKYIDLAIETRDICQRVMLEIECIKFAQ